MASDLVEAIVAQGRRLAGQGIISDDDRKALAQLPPLPREVILDHRDVAAGMCIVVGASGSRLYATQTTGGVKDRAASNLLLRKGDVPFNYVDLTECGA
eukprot:11204667-Lingulodinium_polyedra.AAC.1